jgi:hypothetical protein
MKEATAPLYKEKNKDGGSGGGPGGGGGPPLLTLNSLADIAGRIAADAHGGTAVDPVVLPPLVIDLAAPAPEGWAVPPATVGTNLFDGASPGGITIHVPSGSVAAYTTWAGTYGANFFPQTLTIAGDG